MGRGGGKWLGRGRSEGSAWFGCGGRRALGQLRMISWKFGLEDVVGRG